jgi:hypothetical protein
MVGISAYADLTSHSAAVEEVHVLAAWAAQVVRVVGESGSLLPSELLGLVGEVADRPSVARRLAEMQTAA